MRYDSDLHEPRTNAEQSETAPDLRVSYESLKERLPIKFQARVELCDDGCWLWTGWLDPQGYGYCYHEGRRLGAHRQEARTVIRRQPMVGETIRAALDKIEQRRAAMKPEDRAEVERLELVAQRESWIRAMAPCEHGVADFEECVQCRNQK